MPPEAPPFYKESSRIILTCPRSLSSAASSRREQELSPCPRGTWQMLEAEQGLRRQRGSSKSGEAACPRLRPTTRCPGLLSQG